jgi:hypothetical protein
MRIKSFYLLIFLQFFLSYIAFSQDETAKSNKIIQTLKGKLIQSPAYISQLEKVNSDWQILQSKIINPFDEWLIQQNFTFRKSTSTVYYPFGGPDFLFVQTIYPNSEKYILAGLENIGTIPTINNDQEWINYLKQLNQALRYLHKAGYFVTKQMTEDFKQSDLDGVVHLFLLFLAQLDMQIEQIEFLSLSSEGNLAKCAPKQATALRISFITNENKSKELIYFKQNLANQALEKEKAYQLFLSKQKPFHTYMKSASYILFDKEFTVHRDFILNQSSDIFQDDSGIPLAQLQKQFSVDAYGKYTATTKSFPYGFQADLKNLAANNKKLPFKIGYNQWIEETILLYAHNKQEKPVISAKETGIYKFGVQIAALSIPINNEKLKTLGMIPLEIREEQMYKYIIGYFENYEETLKIKNKIVQENFPHAFIVIYKNNERISTNEYFTQKNKALN